MGPVASKWLEGFQTQVDGFADAAELARGEVAEALKASHFAVNAITCRAKSVESTRHKINSQGIGRPSQLLRDLIGVRVITTFASGVDEAAGRLESMFETVDRKDKRGLLDVSEFGYRSVHLIVRMSPSEIGPVAELLRSQFVEVQVRSVVEHAWAEVEHDLRYKSGVKMPGSLGRRFAALAGALELVDREFDSLQHDLVEVIRGYAELYKAPDLVPPQELDSSRLLGLLAARRPHAPSGGPQDLALDLPEAGRLVFLLGEVGIVTDSVLDEHLQKTELKTRIRAFADSQSIDPDQVSLTAVLSLLIMSKADELGVSLFVSDDPGLIEAAGA